MQPIQLLAQEAAGAGFSQLIMIVLLFVVMWVVMIRPQQKRQKELKAKQNSLKAGDKVITIGGMHASVNSVSEKTVSLRIADNTFVKYDRSAIATIVTKKDDASE
ncbi:preprotein translocase subunit YajC [Rubritalea marina]|uniref:preprotein translocase subunit YajC n=1 Tax=Rubritalea marina TaxID=361055 RepID=UPI000367B47D|nr:preprotein translocase subunit YajC [Rubritalea marina]